MNHIYYLYSNRLVMNCARNQIKLAK